MTRRFSVVGLRAAPMALLWMALSAHATSYYVATNGDDNNPGSDTLPWRTVDRANNQVLNSGDAVYLRAGDVFEGTLRLRSGVSYGSNPIGAAVKPIIRGSVNASALLAWSSPSGNGLYEADASSLIKVTKDVHGNDVPGGIGQLFMNGERLVRARYPNVGSGVFPFGARRYLPSGPGTKRDSLLDAKGRPIDPYKHVLDVSNQVRVMDGTVAKVKKVSELLLGPNGTQTLDGADVFYKNSDWFMTRYKVVGEIGTNGLLSLKAEDKSSPDYPADRVAMHELDWPGDTSYPLGAGYGYWLEGKLWMLDAPKEWLYEPTSRKLYVKLPAGVTPQSVVLRASIYVNGITATGVGTSALNVNVENIEVAETRGDAIKIDALSTPVNSFRLDGLKVTNAGRKGIAVLHARPSASATSRSISNTVVEGSINDGIDLSADRRWLDAITWNINVTNSTVRHAGGGYFARAAILLGHHGDATGNQVDYASNIGIHGGKLNLIANNRVTGACLGFDDCGAIYTEGNYYNLNTMESAAGGDANDVKSTISGNHVLGTLVGEDRLDGSAAANGFNSGARSTTAGGIYLDDYSGNVTVTDNYVEGGDAGITLHHGSNNTVRGNTVVGNRAAIWLQENLDAGIKMTGNKIESNVFASTSTEPLVFVQSLYNPTVNLGSFSNNYYASHRSMAFALDDDGAQSSRSRLKTFAQWQASSSTRDAGSTLKATSFGIAALPGASAMITNGVFNGTSTNGWWAYNATVRAPVAGANYLAVSPDVAAPQGSVVGAFRRFNVNPGLSFQLDKGQKYWLTFDAQSDTPGEAVIRFSRSVEPWDDLSVPVRVPVGKAWQSYSRLLTAGEPSVFRDKVQNGVFNGGAVSDAGLNFEFFVDAADANNGKSTVKLANVSLIKAQINSGNAQAQGLHNESASPVSVPCPKGTPASLCTFYVDARSGQSVSFPYTLPAWSGVAWTMTHPMWVDRDRDGIAGDPALGRAGYADVCTGTGDGVNVKENGCPFGK